ncbi:hypothetical protein ABI59_21565 [Acidobacteria bacterium Mor1]|nr:hypothetical protein ABI59_21565 [Acidobacteria bacterium Mor1]
MRQRILLTAFLSLSFVSSFGMIREVPLDQRIEQASLIVEARVVESTPFRNEDDGLIYTAHRLAVSKALKLDASPLDTLRDLTVVTPGGEFDGSLHVVHPSLDLHAGAAGLFFLTSRKAYAGLERAYVPEASVQSFVQYLSDGQAQDPFHTYRDVASELFDVVREQTGAPLTEIAPFVPAHLEQTAPGSSANLETITNFTPTTVRAGVLEVLTINGNNFGTNTGPATVFFDDADDGQGGSFGSIDPEHVVSWSNTQIQVLVPSRVNGVSAGTGRIIVRNSSGQDFQSSSDLTIQYGLNSINSGGQIYRIKTLDLNGRGGVTYKYSTSTANNGVDITTIPDATARFEDAISDWNCSSDWNVDVDGTTTIAAPVDDGVNIAAFDSDTTALPSGVLGRATSYFSSCGGDTWRVTGMDIVFRRNGTDGVNWYYGASPGGIGIFDSDFYSVALHELGHHVQHNHINDTSDVMYFSLTQGTTSRNLSTADVQGGADIVNHSSGFSGCGQSGMQNYSCVDPPVPDFTAAPTMNCGSSATVNFTDLSTNGPNSWLWNFGDSGSSTVRNPAHNYTSQGLYTVSLQATDENGGSTETKDNFIAVADAPVSASCNPTFAGHNNCCRIGLINVTLAGLNKTTDTNTEGDPLQENFTCSDMAGLEAGQSYPISVTTGPSNNENVRVYVDWDNDGILEAGELAFESINMLENHSGSISVPTSAVRETALRMRVLSDFSSISSPCENIEFGQVEDYSLLVAADAAAGIPGEIASLQVDKNANPAWLDLSWGASCGVGASDYTIHEGVIGSYYSHTATECTTAGATSFSGLVPGAGSRYYLVVPTSTTAEGSYGPDSSGSERPVSTSVCVATQDATVCP